MTCSRKSNGQRLQTCTAITTALVNPNMEQSFSSRASEIAAGLSLLSILDSEPNTRQSGSMLVLKYGLRNLRKFQYLNARVPLSIPGAKRLELFSSLFCAPKEYVEELKIAVERTAPKFLSFEPFSNREVLAPPVKYCLNGCIFKKGVKRNTPRSLAWHRKPIKATLFCLSGEKRELDVLTFRCLSCKSRYRYSVWVNRCGQTYSMYDEEQPYLQVTQEVYFDNAMQRHLTNSIMHGQITFEGFATEKQETHDWGTEFSRKIVSRAFFFGQIREELRERGMPDYKFKSGRDLFQCLPDVEKLIFSSVYEHECVEGCEEQNCRTLATGDGFWKVGFRTCAETVINRVHNMPLINYPNQCTRGTAGNSKYCADHPIERKQRKTRSTKAPAEVEADLLIPGGALLIDLVENEGKSLDDILQSDTGHANNSKRSSTECPEIDLTKECRKNKGEGERGYCYSRGYFFIVRGSGIIDSFAPLFRAESLSQVFLVFIVWLYQRLQDVPEQEWSKFVVAYDNMCQLDRLKATKQPLPLPEPYCNMWSKVTKIIDGLHISNHKNPSCRKNYGPKKLQTASEAKANTMSAEQTFSWLVKYKKQLNSMNRDHQIFFINRLIIHRNRYIAKCFKHKRKVVGPGPRTFAERRNQF